MADYFDFYKDLKKSESEILPHKPLGFGEKYANKAPFCNPAERIENNLVRICPENKLGELENLFFDSSRIILEKRIDAPKVHDRYGMAKDGIKNRG